MDGGGWEACEGNWEERRNIGGNVKKRAKQKQTTPPKKNKISIGIV